MTTTDKDRQILLRSILLIVLTGRCYEYEGKYYEHLGSISVKDPQNRSWVPYERYVVIDDPKRTEYARESKEFHGRFKHVTEQGKVIKAFKIEVDE